MTTNTAFRELALLEQIEALKENEKKLHSLIQGTQDLFDKIQKERDALKADAKRYRWLRQQPNDTSAPRVDVVFWEVEDESMNSGKSLMMEAAEALRMAQTSKSLKGNCGSDGVTLPQLPIPAMLTHGAVDPTEKPWFTKEQMLQFQHDTVGHCAKLLIVAQAEVYELRSQLAALEAQEPVAEIDGQGVLWRVNPRKFTIGARLYLAAGAPPVDAPLKNPENSKIIKAAQDLIDRWNSPKWDWHKQGDTADLIVALKDAVAAAQKGQP